MIAPLLTAALAAITYAQAPPVSGGIRFTASSFRIPRNPDGSLGSNKLTSWSDSNSAYTVLQATATLQPTITESAIHCHSALRFSAGTNLATAGDVDMFDPGDGNFTVFALTQELGTGSALVVSKGTAWGPNFWGIAQGINSGDTLIWLSSQTTAAGGGATAKQTFADTNRWTVLGFTAEATGNMVGQNSEKRLTTFRDGSTANWIIGAYTANNLYTGIINNTLPFRIGGNAQVMDVLVYPKALTPAERISVSAWYDSTYFLTCPTLNSTNAVNGQDAKTACTAPNTRYWSECRQTCVPGWTATYGGTEHMCVAGEWTTSPVVCEHTCPALAAPANVGSCVRTLLDITGFSLIGKTVSFLDEKWFVYPRVPRTERSKYWNVASQQIQTRVATTTCGTTRPSALVIDKPLWQGNLAFSQAVTLTADVYIIQGSVGFVARWIDENNHVRVWLNSGGTANYHVIELVSGGVKKQLANATYTFSFGATYSVKLTVQGQDISVYDITMGANNLMVKAQSSVLRTGTYGLLSDGQANFFAMKLTSDCDSGNSVLSAAPGTTATYTCAPGFTANGGSASRVCSDDGSVGSWTNSPLVCSIDPPTINVTAKSIRENSLEGIVVSGGPVEAYSNALGAIMTYSITNQVPYPHFDINSCSGLLTVKAGASIDFENSQVQSNGGKYTLTIEAVANGDSSRAGSANIDIVVIDVNEPPVFTFAVNGIVSMNVDEDAAVGIQVMPASAAVAVDPDIFGPAAYRDNQYVIELDAFPEGMFSISPTGWVYVNKSNALDFETQPEVELRVRAEDTADLNLFTTATVRITVNDRNEKPIMSSPQEIELDETEAKAGAQLPLPVGARDPDAGSVVTFSISGVTTDNNNKDPDFPATPAVFSVNGASGYLTWVVDKSSWLPTAPTRVVNGRLVRQVYNVWVTATDNGAPSLANSALVKVYLIANLTASGMPFMSDYAITTPGPTVLPSALGGQTLTITGQNFVRAPAYTAVVVNFTEYDAGEKVVRAPYQAKSCTIVNTNTVRCLTPAGIGTSLRIEMAFRATTGEMITAVFKNPLVMGYEAPTVTKVVGATVYDQWGYPVYPYQHKLRTNGGTRFYLYGTGFGLETQYIKFWAGSITSWSPTVIVEPWFEATVVASNGTMLTLDCGAGFGDYLFPYVQVGTQVAFSSDYTMSFGYVNPRIVTLTAGYPWSSASPGYEIDTLPTSYPYITVKGEFGTFPPNPYTIKGQNYYPTVEGYYANNLAYPNGCSWESPTTGCFKMTGCSPYWSSPYDTIYCYTAGSIGANHTLTLVIKDHADTQWVTSDPSHKSVPYGKPGANATFGHSKPSITLVSGIGTKNADTAGGQTIVIDGTNLGPTTLNSITYGLAGIQVRYGNRLWIPDTEANFYSRYQFAAQNCKVTYASGITGRIECDTGEGYGVGHSLRLTVGGQFSNTKDNVINYGAPIISSFEGPGAYDANTAGGQEIVIRGRNFANNISVVQVDYHQVLDPARTSTIPTTFVQQLGVTVTQVVSQANYSTIGNCKYVVNHTALNCTLGPGGGENLKWRVFVDGQLSREPYSSYGAFQVFNVTLGNYYGMPGWQPADALNPNGGQIVYLLGQNFGWPKRASPAPTILLQWLRFGLPGNDPQYITRTALAVDAHDKMRAITPAGYGQGLSFQGMVADQESGPTMGKFSYVKPNIVRIEPKNGTTKSIAPDQYRMRIFVNNAPWSDAANQYRMSVGNAADNSINSAGYILCQRDPTVVGTVQSVSCPMPQGMGKRRAVLLHIDRPGVAGSQISVDIPTPDTVSFDYFEPYVAYTAADPASDPAWNVTVSNLMGPTYFPSARVITIFGRDFGPATFGTVTREVLLRPKNASLGPMEGWVAVPSALPPATVRGPNVMYSWTHDQIVLLTTETMAEARIRITGKDIDPAIVLGAGYTIYPGGTGGATNEYSYSNIFDISVTKPSIRSLEGIPQGGFSTAGGEPLILNVPWPTFSSGAADFVITVGDDGQQPGQCQVLNRRFDGTPSTYSGPGSASGDAAATYSRSTAGAFLIDNCRQQFGGAVTDNSVCRFYCRMPEAVGGTTVPVRLTIDGQDSDVRRLFFKYPIVESIVVTDTYGNPPSPPSTTYNVLAQPDAVVTAPTSNATLTITGTNLGICGTVVIGTDDANMHVVDTCKVLPAASRSHTRIVLPVPEGAGSAFPDLFSGSFMKKLSIAVRAGDQRNVQPSNLTIGFAYLPPKVTDVSPLSAPTRGGVTITVRGRNFGAPNQLSASIPVVELSLNDGAPPVVCANVTRLDHFTVQCDVPEGTGAAMHVITKVADQSGDSALANRYFSYYRPEIYNVSVETWPEALYENWPATWNANRTGVNGTANSPTWFNYSSSASSIGGPTAGRYLVRLRGVNFGPSSNTTNCVAVRFNHAAIDCRIPDNRDYDRRCLCADKNTAASKRDGADIPLCEWNWMDSIREADNGRAVKCNGVEDFFGEGEVHNDNQALLYKVLGQYMGITDDVVPLMQSLDSLGAGYILSWDHEEILMIMPPGMGPSVLSISARGQYPPSYREVAWRYNSPTIASVKSISGGTQTGPAANDIIEIQGRDLGQGFPLAAADDLPVQGAGGAFFRGPGVTGISPSLVADLMTVKTRGSIPVRRPLYTIKETEAVPGAHVTLKWWLFCLTNTGGYSADMSCAASKNSTRFAILRHTHNSIIFRSHPGIGADRQGFLYTHNDNVVVDAANFTFSYDRPTPISTDPQIMHMPKEDVVTLNGFNFGDEADAALYSEEEKTARVTIDGQLSDEPPVRSAGPTNDRIPAMSYLTTKFSGLTVGKKDILVSVAGQSGWMFKNTSWTKPLYAVCSSGYFGRLGETCLECPPGALCDGYLNMDEKKLNMSDPVDANRPHGYPRPIREYYSLNTSDLLTEGMDAACPEDVRALYPDRPDVCVVGCLPPEACAGDNYCTEGYVSKEPYYRCGSCDKGYYRRNNECVKCPDSPWLLVIGFCLLAVGFCFIGFFLNKQNVNIAFLSIAVDYAQVVSMFANSRIAWPPEIKELLHILSAFNLNIEIIAPECIKPDISYIQKWGAIMLLPLSAVVLFMGVFAANYLWKRFIKRQRGRAILLSHQDALIAMFLILFYFMYLYITRTLLEVFNCVETDPPDGKKYMAAVFEPCGKPGGTQLFLLPMAIAGLLLYTSGYPCFCAFVLYKYKFEVMLDQLLRARGTGDSQMTNPTSHWMRIRFSRLYYQYKPDYYAWMLLVLMRKFMIAFTALMFRKDGGFQMAVALLVLFAAYGLQVKYEPFMSPSDRADVLRDHERARFEGGIHARLAESLKEAQAKERKATRRIDWSAPKSVLGKQILNRAGLFLFNYNTVEAVLLGCAILVCLAGIMFESLANRKDSNAVVQSLRVLPVNQRQCSASYKDYCTGLMWGVIWLIAFSIVYIIVVVTVEVHGAMQEAKLARADNARRAKMAKKLGLDHSGGSTPKGSRLSRGIAAVTKTVDGDDVMSDNGFSSRIGVVEQAVNPLFANAKGGNVEDSSAQSGPMDMDTLLSASSMADMEELPNVHTWNVMRETYRSLVTASISQRQQIADLKRNLQEIEAMKDAEAAREEDVMASYGVSRERATKEERPSPRGGNRIASSFSEEPVAASSPIVRGGSRPGSVEPNPRAQLSQYAGRQSSRNLGSKKSFGPVRDRE